ncbi:MAG: hypothetical protein ABIT70_09310 [Sulfuriferula sp.]
MKTANPSKDRSAELQDFRHRFPLAEKPPQKTRTSSFADHAVEYRQDKGQINLPLVHCFDASNNQSEITCTSATPDKAAYSCGKHPTCTPSTRPFGLTWPLPDF